MTVAIILSIASTRPVESDCAEKREIFITSNGVHLNIIVPKNLLKAKTLQELNIPDQARFVSFGWGDREFYLNTPTWDQLKFKVAIKAAFLKSESAMHVDYYFSELQSWNELRLCEQQFNKLINYIMNSFKRDDSGLVIAIDAPGYFKTDTFYEANGNYTIFKTSNNWVNIGLKQANVETSIWSPFDYGVLYHLKKDSVN